jgi:hypothetical protein
LQLKWVLFGLEIYFSLVVCNGLFFVPGSYIGDRGWVIAIALALTIVTAWASGGLFVAGAQRQARPVALLRTPPAVVCIVVLLLTILIMDMAVFATRRPE